MTDPRSLSTIADILHARAELHPSAEAYRYLKTGEVDGPASVWSYARMDERARAIGQVLQERGLTGERVMLVFTPGMDFVQAFLGCMYAGAIAVPAYPPDPNRLDRTLPRFQAVVQSSGAKLAMTSTAMLQATQMLGMMAPELASLEWLGVGQVDSEAATRWTRPAIDGDTIAFLQFTSGSTGSPKGVVIRHRQLLANEAMMAERAQSNRETVLMNWVPFYHDLGLIGGVLHGLYVGGLSVLMSPMHFLQRPMRWLEAISHFRAHLSAAPNFAFDLCVRKSTEEDLEGLDLSSWTMALVGAEPVRPSTMRAFSERFASTGFRSGTIFPGYGMAECVLSTSGPKLGSGFRSLTLEAHALQENRIVPAETGIEFAGNGPPLEGSEIRIVDPQSFRSVESVGEIWLHGPHVASGYWERPEETEAVFAGSLEGDDRHWLRTGDLGFLHDGEIYITGRIKDLIILRGRNHYPQDIEAVAEASHPGIRPGCSAAFSVADGDGERLVLVAEFDVRTGDPDEAAAAVRTAVARTAEAEVSEVVFVKPRSIPKTSSGKIQRRACRTALERDELTVLHRLGVPVVAPAPVVAFPSIEEGAEAVTGWLIALLTPRAGGMAVDAESSFDALGLDSQNLVELSTEVGEAVGKDLAPSAFYDHPTVGALAAHLQATRVRNRVDQVLAETTEALGVLVGAASDRDLALLRERLVNAALGKTMDTTPIEESVELASAEDLTVELVKMIGGGLDADCMVYLYDATQTADQELCLFGSSDDRPSFAFRVDEGLAGAMFQREGVLNLAHLEEHPTYRPDLEAPASPGAHAALYTPVHGPTGEVVGVLQAFRPASRPFTRLDERILSGLADAARPAIQRAVLESQTRRLAALERESLLLASSDSDTSPLKVVLDRLMATLVEMYGVDRGSVLLHDPRTDELVAAVFDVQADGGSVEEVRFPAGKGIAGAVLRSGRSEFVRDAYADPRFNRQIDLDTGFHTRTIDAVPLPGENGTPIGVLSLLNRDTLTWTKADRDTLQRVAKQAAEAIRSTVFFETLAGPQNTPKRRKTTNSLSEPIAVVGMGCRYPGGVDSPEALWELLMNEGDAITPVPAERWDVDALQARMPDVKLARFGGFLDDIEALDTTFFGIAPREARAMDPQQRLLLHVCWEALERAGLATADLTGSRTGVYVGVSNSDFGGRLLHRTEPEDIDPYAITGNAFSVAAGRVSYLLGLKGPSMAVDTACSASLVSLHLAVRALQAGECDAALAGGVNALLSPGATVGFSRLQAMAPDGRCKTFDASADGYVRSEGCGMVVLKRLSDATAAGDPVLAVIRGSAVNHDGRTNGLTAPSGPSQVEVVRDALAAAARRPDQVTFIEAHGTGTALGDPIELSALAESVGGATRESPVWVGSLKTNIGHTESAAGIAGVIKTVLALQHRALPPHLHFRAPTPHVDWSTSGLAVAAEHTQLDDGVLLAGVSSFGIGGTNAHVVIEQAPVRETPASPSDPTAWMLPLSARHPSVLPALARQMAAVVRSEDLATVVKTAVTRRSHHPFRWAFVGCSSETLAEELEARAAAPVSGERVKGAARPVMLFSGQGGQWREMSRELLASSAAFRHTIDACAAAFAPHVDWSLQELLRGRLPPETWDRDDVIQPALFAVQVSLAALWQDQGVQPAMVVGHSMGEVAAAHVAGALDLDSAARVICLRSQLAASTADGGGMALVGLSQEAIQSYLADEPTVTIACVNGPKTLVLAGDAERLAALVERLDAEEVFARKVGVAYASHSAFVEPARVALEAALAGQISPSEPTIPWWSTARNALVNEAPEASYWGENLRSPVQFWPAVQELVARGFDTFIEVNPHPLLIGAIEAALGSGRVATFGSLQRDQGSLVDFLRQRAALYEAGHPLEPASAPAGPTLPAVLPTYPWRLGDESVTDLDTTARDAGSIVAGEVARLLGLSPGSRPDGLLTLAEQGFDSIMAMQLAARLQRHGLTVTPAAAQRAGTLTLAELTEAVHAEGDGELPAAVGPVPLTPSVGWLMSVDPVDLHHRNISLLLEADGLDVDALRDAVEQLAAQHDAFGLRYRDGVQLAADAMLPFEHVELGGFSELEPALAAHTAEVSASLDLREGPLGRVVWYTHGQAGRLFVTVHHLISDGYAVVQMLRELDQRYGRRVGDDPHGASPRPLPWSTWARSVEVTPYLDEVEFWSDYGASDAPPLPVVDGDPSNADSRTAVLRVPAEKSEALRQQAAAFGLDALVLAALATANSAWAGRPVAHVSRIVHGRTDDPEGRDLTRTLGYLATAHPVHIAPQADVSREDVLRDIRRTLDRVPNGGVGFFTLFTLGPVEVQQRFAALPVPQVRFNVVGDLMAELESGTRWTVASETTGPAISRARHREAELDLWVMWKDGSLEIHAEHSPGRLPIDWVDSLLSRLQGALEA